MRLEEITAWPHPGGNRIDLVWVNPDPEKYPRVRVVRRARTHPITPEDGVVVPQFSLDLSFQDELDDKKAPTSDLHSQFAKHRAPLTQNAAIVVKDTGSRWCIQDGEQEYTILNKGNRLDVCNERLSFALDQDLKGETVYYYTLFPYVQDALAEDDLDPHNRAAAMATGPSNLAARMYDLLPRIYHRYDSPPGVAPALAQQLRRFLDLPGGQLDQLYSMARALLDAHNVEEVDGCLLPLLAQWIGWSLDHRNEIDRQRNEIRQAPYVQATIGIIPTLEATVKRIFGWECRTKEFVHNVFLSNQPPRLNLYACEAAGEGQWSLPTQPLSLDYAYEGRPAAVETTENPDPDPGERHTLWLFYHTRRKEQWDIWIKTRETFGLSIPIPRAFRQGTATEELRQAFEAQGVALSHHVRASRLPGSTPDEPKPGWQFVDDENEATGVIEPEGDGTRVRLWQPSQPLTDRPAIDRHPTAAIQWSPPSMTKQKERRVWLFWDAYDEDRCAWRIDGRIHTAEEGWTACKAWPFKQDGVERRRPCAVADDKGGVWIVWSEREGTDWRFKYNRHNGFVWQSEKGTDVPQIEEQYQHFEDLFLLFDGKRDPPRLWLFGARKVPVEPAEQAPDPEDRYAVANPIRWEIVYLVKEIGKGTKGNYLLQREEPWIKKVFRFRTATDQEQPVDDREPAAWVNEDGQVELFWSSNRDGSWSVWRSVLNVGPGPVPGWPVKHQWAPAEPVTGAPYMQRDPLPAGGAGDRLLLFRSNQSLAYTSSLYGATETLDGRYAGCTTVDTRNLPKLALQGQYEDSQTYTYDAGQEGVRTDQDWYARDTVGFYLTPDTDDCNLILRNQYLIEQIIREFLPIQVRPVFIIPVVSRELVYTYDFPDVEQKLIGERFVDTTLPEIPFGSRDSHSKDVVPGWILMRAWGVGDEDPELEHLRVTVNLKKDPPETRFRTWHGALEMEDEPWT